MKREGNILSRVIRDAWDGRERLQTLTKNSPTKATNACISIVAHITVEELRRMLDETAMANGFANRFLFACVKRSTLLPLGGAFPGDDHATGRNNQNSNTDRPTHRRQRHERAGASAMVPSLSCAFERRRAAIGPHHLARGGANGTASVDLCPARSSRNDRRGAPRGRTGGVEVLRSLGTLRLRRQTGRSGGRPDPADAAARCKWHVQE